MTTFNSQMFYLGTFADMDTDEADFDAEGHANILGTYVKPALTNVTVEDGDSNGSINDDELGTSPTEYVSYDLGGGLTVQYIDSTIVYNVAVLLGDGSTSNMFGTVIQLQNGDVFLTDYANLGAMDNLSVQSVTLSSPDSFFTGFIPASSISGTTVVCFASGTRILTAEGYRPIEHIRAGDLVLTHSNALQPAIGLVSRPVPKRAKDQPICISSGALGPGAPARRLRLSPEHRILARGPLAVRMFGQTEILLSAKSLLSLPGVSQEKAAPTDRYWHLICPTHEIVFAEECPAETLFSGSQALAALQTAPVTRHAAQLLAFQRHERLARFCPTMTRQRRFLARSLRNGKAVCKPFPETVE